MAQHNAWNSLGNPFSAICNSSSLSMFTSTVGSLPLLSFIFCTYTLTGLASFLVLCSSIMRLRILDIEIEVNLFSSVCQILEANFSQAQTLKKTHAN